LKPWSPIVCALWLGSIASSALAQQRQHGTSAHAHPAPEAAPHEQAQGEITQAERDKQARLQFEQGRKAFDEGDYRAAWGYFHEAYRLSGRAQLLFNIGQTADRLGQDSDALTSFKMYLERLPAADNRRDVENRIRALEARVKEAERVPGPPGSTPPASEVSPPPTAADAETTAQPSAADASDVAAPGPPPTAAAAPRPTRKGMYLRIGVGMGLRLDGVSGGVDGTLSGVGFAGELALGATLWPGFVLGGAIFSDLASSPTFESKAGTKAELSSAHLSMFGPMADWYFSPAENGFHVQAALTFAVVSIDYQSAGVSIGRSASGIGAVIGAGYEWAVADEWAVGALARVSLAGLSDDSLSHGLFAPSLVATVTWY
jgi:hypothetical protein